MLDGRAVDRTGVGYTKNSEVIQFELSDKVYATRQVTWQIKFTHSPATEDSTLHCEAQYTYSTGLSRSVHVFLIENCLNFHSEEIFAGSRSYHWYEIYIRLTLEFLDLSNFC